jgi:hypothetical protein
VEQGPTKREQQEWRRADKEGAAGGRRARPKGGTGGPTGKIAVGRASDVDGSAQCR